MAFTSGEIIGTAATVIALVFVVMNLINARAAARAGATAAITSLQARFAGEVYAALSDPHWVPLPGEQEYAARVYMSVVTEVRCCLRLRCAVCLRVLHAVQRAWRPFTNVTLNLPLMLLITIMEHQTV